MTRLLMTWELGANYGHLARLIPVAEAQRKLGREVLFAVCNLETAEKLLTPKGFSFVAAPKIRYADNKGVAANYVETLLAIGYADKMGLQQAVGAWLDLFNQYQPDLIIVDHSPTALLSNRVAKRSVMQIGAGFEIPPQDHWPAIRPINDLQKTQLKASEQLLLDAMNHVVEALGGTAMQSATELFSDCHQLLTTFAELDHYRDRKHARYIGPVYDVGHGQQVAWLHSQTKRIVVYAWPGLAGLNQLMAALASLEVEVVVVIPGLTDEASSHFSRPTIQIFRAPVNFDGLLEQADLLITHSGFGTVSAFLKRGVPIIVVPDTLEQFLIGQRIVSLGAGLMVGPKRSLNNFIEIISHVLKTPLFREAAQLFAKRYQGWDATFPVKESAYVIDRLLSSAHCVIPSYDNESDRKPAAL